jgi:hypothetical protein
MSRAIPAPVRPRNRVRALVRWVLVVMSSRLLRLLVGLEVEEEEEGEDDSRDRWRYFHRGCLRLRVRGG